MSLPTIHLTSPAPYEATLAAVREQLAAAGFGIISEIDLQATVRNKLGIEIAPQVILGACRPDLAHRAITVAPSVATLLPCNVVVRSEGAVTVVEAFDPAVISQFEPDAGELGEIAADARDRLVTALAATAGVLA